MLFRLWRQRKYNSKEWYTPPHDKSYNKDFRFEIKIALAHWQKVAGSANSWNIHDHWPLPQRKIHWQDKTKPKHQTKIAKRQTQNHYHRITHKKAKHKKNYLTIVLLRSLGSGPSPITLEDAVNNQDQHCQNHHQHLGRSQGSILFHFHENSPHQFYNIPKIITSSIIINFIKL